MKKAKTADSVIATGTTPLNKIIEWPDNPRKTRDDAAVDDLAASMLAKSQIVPFLIVAVPNSDLFYAIDGESRRQALNKNVDAGKAEPDMAVLTQVLDPSLTTAQLISIALTANTIRRSMNPIEEMEAFSEMRLTGMKELEIAQIFNLDSREVRQRISLGQLVDSARDLVRSGKRQIAWASAMTVGSPQQQEKIVAEIAANPAAFSDAHSVRTELGRGTIPAESALFDPSLLSSCLTIDLFTPNGGGFFTDASAFWKLQNEEIDKRIAEYAKTYGPRVEYFDRRRFDDAGWISGGDPADSWAIIVSYDDGSVRFHEGMIRPAHAETGGEGDWLNSTPAAFSSDLDTALDDATATRVEVSPMDNATAGTNAYLAAQVIAGLRLRAAQDHRVAMAFVIAATLCRHGNIASSMTISGLPIDSRDQTSAVFGQLATERAERNKIVKEAGIAGTTSPAKVVAQCLALNDDALNRLFAWTVSESVACPMNEATFEVYESVGSEVLQGWTIDETYLNTLTNAQVRSLAGEIVDVASQPSRSASVSQVKKAILTAVEDASLQGNWVGSNAAWLPPQVATIKNSVAARAEAEAQAAAATAQAA